MSAAAAIPFVGWAATGAKFAIKGAKLVKKAGKVVDSVVGAATKIADKAGQVAKAIGDLANKAGDAISGALGKVMTKAKGLASNFSPADLANKLKGKLDALIMKSPMLGNGLKMAGGMAKGFMQNLLMSEAMNYGLEQLSQYVDSDTMTKAMILMSMLSGKSKKNQNQGITSNNKGSGDKDKSGKDKDSGNKDKDKPKDKDKTKDKTKDEPNKPKPKDQETDKSKGKTGDNPKDSSSSDTKKDKERTEGTGKTDDSPALKQTEFASEYEARLNQTPAPKNKTVGFEGQRGESKCILKPPPDPELKKILDEAGINGINYKNGVPDFSPVAKAQLEIEHMVGGIGSNGTKARAANFKQADIKLAEQLNNSPELASQFGLTPGKIKAGDIADIREEFKLTWHELNDGRTIQLVPSAINSKFGHLGGVGEINAGAFEPGGFAYN